MVHADVETIVYRFYAEDGRLLYVGITEEVAKRFLRHSERLWWPEALTVRLEVYAARSEALAVEADAISNESPLHNRMVPPEPHDFLPLPLSTKFMLVRDIPLKHRLRLRKR